MVMADCTEKDGSPVALDPRHIVRTAVERLAKLGYTATVATEIEFYLCDESWQPLHAEIQCYGITKGAELEPILSDIRRKVEEFGIVVEACNSEYGPCQIEINLKYGDPLQVADDTALFKSAVKEIARQHGVRATFMSKPFPGFSGNGTHIHISLRDADGTNAFAPKDARRPVLHERADEALRRPACCTTSSSWRRSAARPSTPTSGSRTTRSRPPT